jgi:2'-5' RNA ligase
MSKQNNSTQTKRLFFALWPGSDTREAMYQVACTLKKQTDGRLVNLENLHLTLAFLGSVTQQQQDCMQKVASQIHIPRFTMTLSELGYWPRPKVAWIGARDIPAGLMQLATSLNANLETCGYQPEKRPFQAHITLLRKAKRHPQDTQTPEINWSVDRFVLVESITHAQGVKYQIVAEWPLS